MNGVMQIYFERLKNILWYSFIDLITLFFYFAIIYLIMLFIYVMLFLFVCLYLFFHLFCLLSYLLHGAFDNKCYSKHKTHKYATTEMKHLEHIKLLKATLI